MPTFPVEQPNAAFGQEGHFLCEVAVVVNDVATGRLLGLGVYDNLGGAFICGVEG